MALTKRQKEVLGYIRTYIEKHQYSPSVRDIASHFSLATAGGVHKHLKNLKDKSIISYEENISRSIRILEPSGEEAAAEADYQGRLVDLPLKGKVAAGFPIQYFIENESMLFPEYLVRNPEKTYVLQVQGDSMIEECICDGDYILVEHRDYANNGEMVVAMINFTEATLKKFFLEGDNVRLQPANFKMNPMIVNPKNVTIHGIVVGVWRNYRP